MGLIKNIDDLNKFDFTEECKSCKYRRDFGLMEYCCGFVLDLLELEQLKVLKKNIISYVLDDNVSKLDKDNVFFDKDDMWTVTVLFQTNLREDKYLIEKELRKAILDSPFFTGVNFEKDTLYKHDYNTGESVLIESRLEKYIKEKSEKESSV